MVKSTNMKAEYASSAAFGPNLKPWARTSPPHPEPSCPRSSPPRVYPYISHTSHTFAALAPSSPMGSVRGSSGHVTDVQRLRRQGTRSSCPAVPPTAPVVSSLHT